MPRTPLALVPLGVKDKEDVLLRYITFVHTHKQCLSLFLDVCSRFIAVSINISKTAGHHYVLGVVAWPCGGFCIKRFLIEPGKGHCLVFP